MKQETFINITSPAPREVWQELLLSDREAIPYQMPAWLDAICATGGYQDASRLYETASGQQLLLPMVRRSGLPTILTTEASLPSSWGMGGVLARKPIQAEELAALFADLASLPVLRTTIRPNPRLGEIWAAAAPQGAVAIPGLAHVLDLEGGFEKVWMKRFKKNTRRRIRKAERHSQLVVECDTTGKLVPVFYDLLECSFKRWARQQNEPLWLTRWRGQQRDPLRKFELIADLMGDACRIWVAWIDGQPAAASLVLQYGNVNDSRNAMDKELVGVSGANDLLLKLSIEDACQAGCRYYHLGESGSSKGLAHFKERFGALPYPYAKYHLERIPITSFDASLRGFVKRLIGFKDV